MESRPSATVTYDGFCALPWEIDVPSLKVSSPSVQTLLARLPDSEFALICTGPEGQMHRLLPMATPELAKHSSAVLVGLHDVLPAGMAGGVAQVLRARLVDLENDAPHSLKLVCSGTPRRYWTWDDEWDLQASEYARVAKMSQAKTGPVLHRIKVSANPLLTESRDTEIHIRSASQLYALQKWLSQSHQKLSSYTKQCVAEGILQGYAQLGVDALRTKQAQQAYGDIHKISCNLQSVRNNVDLYLDLRQEALENVKLSSDTIPHGETLIASYESTLGELQGATLSPTQAYPYALKISHLDEALGMQEQVIDAFHMFFPTMHEKLSSPKSSPVVYSQGALILREEDFAKLELLPLRALKEVFSKDTIQGLRDKPVETFKGMSSSSQRWVANYINDRVQGSGAYAYAKPA